MSKKNAVTINNIVLVLCTRLQQWGLQGWLLSDCQKLLESFPLCPTEPVPTSTKTDSLLAKDMLIRNAGSTPGIRDLKRGKKSLCRGNFSQRKEERM